MDDDALIDALSRASLRFDPVPESALRVANGALAWRDVDAELAALLSDSAVEDEALAGVRSIALPRLLVFESGALEVELELEEEQDGRRVVGLIAPGGAARVIVETARGTVAETAADDLGRFAVAVPEGPFRLRIERPGAAPVVTGVIA